MAAANFIIAIYQKFWDLIEAHSPTAGTLREGNEVREDRGKPYPRDVRGPKQAADFPRVYLRHTGISDTGFTQDPTFAAMESDIVTVGDGWNEQVTLTYDAKIVHDDLNLTPASLFELELMTAVRKGGPRLALDYVVGWTASAKTEETDKDPDAAGRMRRVTTITITVTCQFEGTELIV